MKLVINGITISKSDYTGGNSASLDISVADSDGARKKTISSEFVLRGDAFSIVETELIEDPLGKNKSIPVVIYEENCCDTDILIFQGILRGDMVNWCFGDCECKVTFIEQTEESLKIDCIKSTQVFDNWNGFQEQIHPRIVYCVEIRPGFAQYLTVIFGIILNIVLFALYPIISVLSAIIYFIESIIAGLNALGINVSWNTDFDGDSSTNLLEQFQGFIDTLNELLIGCGREHPSPLVRSYIQNVCDKCGLTFSSTIYNNPESQYYNAVYLSAPVEKGVRDEDILYIEENKPIKNLTGFLDDLNVLHNAKYRTIDNVLYFERHDFFNDGATYVSFEELFNPK